MHCKDHSNEQQPVDTDCLKSSSVCRKKKRKRTGYTGPGKLDILQEEEKTDCESHCRYLYIGSRKREKNCLLSNPGNSIGFYRGTSLPERGRLKVLGSWRNWISPHPTTGQRPKHLASVRACHHKWLFVRTGTGDAGASQHRGTVEGTLESYSALKERSTGFYHTLWLQWENSMHFC